MNKLLLVLLALGGIGIVSIFSGYRPKGSSNASLNEQLVTFLQEYIRIDTSQPHPAYDAAITFLKRHAQQDGFDTHEVSLASGKKVLVITFKGADSSLPALVLNHHMDVVPADAEGWITPPFDGQIHGGAIIGRGTQDMKGIGATHYFALKQLMQEGFVPQRTIHIFAVPDEELGGFTGTKQFVETDFFKQLNIGFIIDEGHASGDAQRLDIKVSERKPIQIQINSQGQMGHGSHLKSENAIHELVQFLNQMVQLHTKQQKLVGLKKPGQLLSCNITSLSAGVKKENGHVALNIVPDTARATLDMRVPPTMKKCEALQLLENALNQFPQVSYKILAQADEEPDLGDYHTVLYQALSSAISHFDLEAQPHYFEASSDLRFYQARGIDGIGFTPFTIVDNIHGINESVPVEQLIRGKDIMVQFVKDFCG